MGTKIVVLGAGYAGIFLCTNLSSKLKDLAEIILIDRNDYHQLVQEIHLVASGFRTEEQLKIPISSLIYGKKIKFIQSNVKKIIPDKSTVILDSEEIKYDELIVCLGSSTKYFNIPGADKYTLPLRSIYDASIIYDHISKIVEEEEEKQNIVIVGAGATGISLGSALAEMINLSKNKDNVKVNIIEATSTILYGWDVRLKNRIEDILKKRGIRIFHNSLVERVDQNTLFLKDGLQINSSLIIWTAGVKGFNIDIEPSIEKTNDGRIIVNEFCRTNQYENIYSIGDIAAMRDSKGALYPPLAQIAVRQARYLADHISDHYINKTEPKERFDYEIKAQILSLGNNEYVGVLNNLVVSGDIAKMIDEFTKNTYMKSLKAGGRNISVNLYENDFFSQVLAGMTFAGFTFFKGLEKLAK